MESVNITNKKYHDSFVCRNGETVDVYFLGTDNFHEVWGFYDREIAMLENVADFYPYKKSELESILSGGGVFLGGYIRGELAGLCGIDFDSEYQVGIKKANEAFPNFPFEDDILEFSGLFVAKKFRKLGISEKMSRMLLEIKKEVKPNSRLFAVVLESNVPSMKSFFSLGFKLFGWWQMNPQYKFVYMISPVAEMARFDGGDAEKVEVSQIVEKLKAGYVFNGVEEDGKLLGEKLR